MRIVKWENVYAILLYENKGIKIVYIYPINIGTIY